MVYETLKNINQIIERDSKDTTYKFALLRATIEVIQQKNHHASIENEKVYLPVGLLVLRWLEYYYPIIEAKLPQKNGDNFDTNTLTFRSDFEEITEYFRDKGRYPVFYKSLVDGNYSDEIEHSVYRLCKKIRYTITRQPMRYIGRSVYGKTYQIYKPVNSLRRLRRPDLFDAGFMIERFGKFTVPKEYYNVFNYMGSFITGTHSLLLNWAQFTYEKNPGDLSLEKVLPIILSSPLNPRDTELSARIFNRFINTHGKLNCVWSGSQITLDKNIDHVLPFSIWRNNDLWNLLPAKGTVNRNKNDKIPSDKTLKNSKERIITYWQFIRQVETSIFEKEIRINLLSSENYNTENWENTAFESLREKCNYLIETRGFQEFNYP